MLFLILCIGIDFLLYTVYKRLENLHSRDLNHFFDNEKSIGEVSLL